MKRLLVVSTVLVVYCSALSSIQAQSDKENKAPKLAGVELRMMELEPIEGVTVEKGTQYSEIGSLGYFHKSPALIVKPSDVERFTVKKIPASDHHKEPRISVEIHLTKDARKRLASKASHGEGMRFVVAYFREKQSSLLQRYEIKTTKGVPDACRAASFIPVLELPSSQANAKDIVSALVGEK